MSGTAIDFRLADVKTPGLKETAMGLKQGGVSYYAQSDFVQMDTTGPGTGK